MNQSEHRLKVRCSYIAKRLLDMDMVNTIKDEYVDEYEVVRNRLEEILKTCKLMRFVITPEMAVGIVISVTYDCACFSLPDPALLDRLLLLISRETGFTDVR